MLNVEDPL